MEGMDRLAGIVLAAGFSRRMGSFKPLLPLSGSTVLGTAVHALLDAGVTEVVVVTGHRAPDLQREIDALGVRSTHNPDYAGGMFTSVRAGVMALPAGADAFFLLPCDIPLVRPATIAALARARAAVGDPPVCYPVFGERRGHPPLVSSRLAPEILAPDDPLGGLRQLLAAHRGHAVHVDVEDPGVVMDLDTPEAYERMVRDLPR